MDQHETERAGGVAPARQKIEWTLPQVERLVAGAAEAAAGADVEGLDGLS